MNNVLSLLGLARRAGDLVMGETLCEEGIKRKKISLMIIAEDLNETTQYRIKRLCETEGVNYIVFSNKESLSKAVGKVNYGLFGVTNKKFSRAIISKMEAL
jgi:ribosomal protein L7Ae-like RNA K-turn-binding protein